MSQFRIRIQYITYGWTGIKLWINDKVIVCNAGDIGSEPLWSLVKTCLSFYATKYQEDNESEEEECITWEKEPGTLRLEMRLDRDRMVHFDIKEYEDDYDEDNEEDNVVSQEWHEIVPFEQFRKAVVDEGFRVLNAFGLYGYYASWMGQTEFPLPQLLRLTGKLDLNWNGDYCSTDLSKEIECLSSYIKDPEIKEDTLYDECIIYYESWQIQCCGDPFEVGEKVEWPCTMPTGYKNAHGVVIDFVEDHHGFSTFSVSGTVDRIIAERSEFPKGKRILNYETAHTIQEEISKANGWESDFKDDETTERTFWGYIVTIKNAVVKPLKTNDEANDNKKEQA